MCQRDVLIYRLLNCKKCSGEEERARYQMLITYYFVMYEYI